MKRRPNYKYKVFNAEICIICDLIVVKDDRQGIRPIICKECWERKGNDIRQLNKKGTYLCEKR